MAPAVGDFDDGGPGVLMRDRDFSNKVQPHYYFFYENDWDERPWKYTVVRNHLKVLSLQLAERMPDPPRY